jgi:plasmid stability protein
MKTRDGATLYLRNVPPELVREAKVKAAREGTSLTAVVIEALARALEGVAETRPPAAAELRESTEWYEANRSRLLKRYRDEYVAILEREVIDHDATFESLAARVFARMGTRPILMPRVTEGRERVRVRSPRRRAS